MAPGIPPETFAELLLRLRRRSGLSASELGERIGMQGRSAVERWEKGDGVPSADVIPALGRELGVVPSVLAKLAGVRLGPVEPDERLAALADQAGNLERMLRALASAPEPQRSAAHSMLEVQSARGRVLAELAAELTPGRGDEEPEIQAVMAKLEKRYSDRRARGKGEEDLLWECWVAVREAAVLTGVFRYAADTQAVPKRKGRRNGRASSG